MKKLLCFLLCFSLSYGALYDLQTLKQKENSIAKDYYIHKLLEKKQISQNEAKNLSEHIFRYQGKIKNALESLVPPKPSYNPKYAKCFNYTSKTILKADSTCQLYRVNYSLYFVSKLDNTTRTKLATKFKNHPETSLILNAFNQKNPLNLLIDNNNTALFLKTWNFLNSPDILLKTSYINKLAKEKGFTEFMRPIIIKQTQPNLLLSFLQISPNNVSGEAAFYLGINALIFKQEPKAVLFFNKAYKSYEKQYDKDNALFWIYQITQKKSDLELLAKSSSLNIYSIWAKQLQKQPLSNFSSLKAKNKKHEFDMNDPFLWQSLSKEIRQANKEKLKTMADSFNAKNTLPIYAFILERANDFKENYFIMPYYEHIKEYDVKRQALILAIARQESRFIPTAVSTSYALGMMQFMPFLANHIAQNELKLEKFEQDDMFEPKTAYFFANHHLDYLESKLGSPVLISYAYNGGIGFTNRMLDKGLFQAGKYEPFLSMELVPYTESRIYAKKVLANYIVYLHLLNDNTSILSIFESLIQNNQATSTASK